MNSIADNKSLFPDDDLIQSGKKSSAKIFLVQFLVGGAFGGTLAYAGMRAMGDLGGSEALLFFIALMFSLWLQLVIHELGHAAAGVSRGMQLLALGIGRIRIERTETGWRPRWGSKITGVGGFAFLLPQSGAAFDKTTQALYLAGGPLANLLTAGLGFLLISVLDLSGLLRGVLIVFAGSGLLLGIVNLIPFYSGGFRTDGGGLIDLWRRPQLVTSYFQIQQIVALSMAGKRPREWPVNLLPDLNAAVDELRLSVTSLRMSWAVDQSNAIAANECASVLWSCYHDEKTAPVHRSYIAMSLAGYAAVLQNDLALTQAWRSRSEGGMLDVSAHLAYLDAEIARLSNHQSDLVKLIDDARSKLHRVHDEGSRVALADRLSWIQNQI
jgi:hypothetical protein